METDNYKMEDVEVYMGVLAEKEEEPVKLPEISKEIYYALPADPEVTKPIELKTRKNQDMFASRGYVFLQIIRDILW